MRTNPRVGYDPIRDLTFIRPYSPFTNQFTENRIEARCPTCGRAYDCNCGPECPCPVTKEHRAAKAIAHAVTE